MNNRFTEKAEATLNRAVKLAEGLGHTYIGTEHILLALCEDESTCAFSMLKKSQLTFEKIYKTTKEISGEGTKSELSSKNTTPRCRCVIENSYRNSKKYFSEKIGTEHILLALLEEKECAAAKILIKLDVDTIGLKDEVITFLRSTERNINLSEPIAEGAIPNLTKYGRNMTKIAETDGFDPVVGREKETERIIRILSRKNKNNPCLIGEAGVGKTAIIEGLATRIASGNVPPSLIGKTIISVDLTSMVAGAKYRGDFEERIKNIINETSKNKSIILFIDEIHSIVGAGSAEGAIDASNIMKPELARGDIRVIGATTVSEYRKYIEKDAALERRFQPVLIEEPTVEGTLDILRGIKDRYEKHHGLIIDDSALRAAVTLSKRYLQDRYLPDKAIDLVDEACAMKYSSAKNSKHLRETKEIFEQNSKSLTINNTVSEKDIRQILFEITGIKVSSSGDSGTKDIREKLTKAVIGQNEAVDVLCKAIKRSVAGINDPEKPRGVFLFLGESGVGKTELAKELAAVIFSSEDALIRFDMSEFSEPYSTSKLIGSAPGYVGYDENNALEKIRRHPYSIILLDEIEKAHPDILSLLLGAFDTGYLTDSSGRRVSFRNSYVILTSNIGKDKFKTGQVGFNSKEERKTLYDKLKPYFKEEFINRIDEIILFSSLDEDSLSRIAEIKINKIKNRTAEKGLIIDVDEEVSRFFGTLAYESGMGARPLNRAITDKLESVVAEKIVNNEVNENTILHISVDHNELVYSVLDRLIKAT